MTATIKIHNDYLIIKYGCNTKICQYHANTVARMATKWLNHMSDNGYRVAVQDKRRKY